MRSIETVADLIPTLAANLSTLNPDTRKPRPMPTIVSGEAGVQFFIEVMKERDLANLAEAVAFAHKVESSRHTDGFSIVDVNQVLTNLRVVNDFRSTVSRNLSLLDAPAIGLVGTGYRTGVTVGDMTLSFYNEALGIKPSDWQSAEPVRYRVLNLSEQQGLSVSANPSQKADFVLSEIMRSLLPKSVPNKRSPQMEVA